MFGIKEETFYTLNQLDKLEELNIGRSALIEILKDLPVVELKARKLYLGIDVLFKLAPSKYKDIGLVPKREKESAA